MTEETTTNVSELLSRRFPSSYFVTYREEDRRKDAFPDDGFIHVQRGRYRHVFYLHPQGTLGEKDVPRFEKAVDKARKQVKRERCEE